MDLETTIKNRFNYDPDTGVFTHRVTLRSDRRAGAVVGTKHPAGYLVASVQGKQYSLHRLAFLLMTGSFPPASVDHINGVEDDNRWRNLRHANYTVNGRNSKLDKRSKTGLPGVCWAAGKQKFQVYISTDTKGQKQLGVFTDFFEACCVRKSAELKHNYHPNHGRN